MTAPDLSVLERVAKLLAKGEDPACTEPEREAFQTKAFEIMAEHRITEAMLQAANPLAHDELGTWMVGRFNGIYGRVRIHVVQAVADSLDVQLFWRGYQNTRNLHAYGFKSDVERVQALSNRLLADADVRAATLQPDPEHVDMFNYDNGTYYASTQGAVQAATIRERRGFYTGYADAIRSRLCRATEAATAAHRQAAGAESSDSAALVLVDRKRQVHESYRQAHPGIKSAAHIGSTGVNGHQAGYAAGSRADLSNRNAVRSTPALGGGR